MDDWRDGVLAGADVAARFHRDLARQLSVLGFSSTEMRLLAIMRRHQQLVDRQLGDQAGMASSQLSREIKKLFERGLVEEAQSPRHKSQRLLSLTAEGLAASDALNSARIEAFDEIYARLSPVDQAALSTLAKMNSAEQQLSSDWTSRPATISDFLTVFKILTSNVPKRAYAEKFLADAAETLAVFFRRANDDYSGVVSTSNEKIVGFCLLMPGATLAQTYEATSMLMVGPYVHSRFRSLGMAKHMLQTCVDQAREHTFVSISTHVSTRTPALAKFLGKHAFRRSKSTTWPDWLDTTKEISAFTRVLKKQ